MSLKGTPFTTEAFGDPPWHSVINKSWFVKIHLTTAMVMPKSQLHDSCKKIQSGKLLELTSLWSSVVDLNEVTSVKMLSEACGACILSFNTHCHWRLCWLSFINPRAIHHIYQRCVSIVESNSTMHDSSTLHIVWVCWPPCTMYMAFDIPGERRGGNLRLALSLKKVKKVQMHWGLNGNLEPRWMEYGIKIVAVDFNWLAGPLPSLLPSFNTDTTLSSSSFLSSFQGFAFFVTTQES